MPGQKLGTGRGHQLLEAIITNLADQKGFGEHRVHGISFTTVKGHSYKIDSIIVKPDSKNKGKRKIKVIVSDEV